MTGLTTNELFSVSGKVALVTGGSRGIGEMTASRFLANGAKVYISSRKAASCEATAARLSQEYGGECVSLPGNVADLDGIDAVAAELSQREPQLDILVNNAGASWGATIDEFPEIGWDKVMDTNVKGRVNNGTKACRQGPGWHLPLADCSAVSQTPTPSPAEGHCPTPQMDASARGGDFRWPPTGTSHGHGHDRASPPRSRAIDAPPIRHSDALAQLE
jgi:nucleoside-diphosphate-sugar epimerase